MSKHNIYNIIGKNIKKYRMRKGITQRKLAENLLLSDSFIAKLESYTSQTLSIDTLELIAKELNEPIISFFDETVMNEKNKR
jgi:Predicted transcriptional regulators